MKIRYLFLVLIVSAGTVAIAAQRTVTNSDLSRYREERLRAETDLRENYSRLGFASPEVRERLNAESQKEMLELSARLKAERLDQERRDAELRRAAWLADVARRQAGNEAEYYDNGLAGNYFFNGRRMVRFGSRRAYTQPGYFAGGQFWATGPGTPPRPAFNLGRHR